ncbi:MAG: tRNA (adenosine(37)-N6)-threonylcarbamoyltransferase complex dimerization subunit type 1 TsaB [Ignavibacteriaceae bacterium]|jgi:tRNA threonylcarbamoyladenosine biosynthesis protein TsaB|nr:tRNA (adenosine(37)-N6)-threonylcarbamoyltransferase complex dimerization subunit type 1 TsaB [Ignavibacteriaceae bacterium]
MNELFPILAIETSDNICGACLYFNDKKYFISNVVLKHSHSEKLFEVIETVLKNGELPVSQIKSIAVSAGPGSFTGLRIGMSAAKGLSASLNIPIIKVPTFEALALQISEVLPDGSIFTIANKVGRDELYHAKFQINSNNYIFNQQLKIVPANSDYLFNDNELVFGNFDSSKIKKKVIHKFISAPNAEYIAKWAEKSGKAFSIHDIDFVEPDYLKDFIVKEKKL